MDNIKDTNPKDRIGTRKAPMSFVPARVLAEVGVGMMEGALKYTPFNWRTAGIRTSVYYDATMRHLMAWQEGEDTDPDSGLSHLTKAICSLMVMRDGIIQGNHTDDRPLQGKVDYFALNNKAASLIDKYPPKGNDGAEVGKDPDGWIEWIGGECPIRLSGTEVDVRFKCGVESGALRADRLIWNHIGSFGDIVAYRIHKE